MADTDASSPIVRYNLILNRLEYFNGSDWYAANTSSGAPLTPAVETVVTALFNTTSSTAVPTTTTVTFPGLSDASHKVKITVTGPLRCDSTTSDNAYLSVWRDGTSLVNGVYLGLASSTDATTTVPACICALDVPGDTASHVYTVYLASGDNTTPAWFPTGAPNQNSVIIAEEII